MSLFAWDALETLLFYFAIVGIAIFVPLLLVLWFLAEMGYQARKRQEKAFRDRNLLK